MIYQVARLIADVIVIAILAGHDDFAGLLGELFKQLVLDIREQARRIALLRRDIAARVDGNGQPLEGLADVAGLYVAVLTPIWVSYLIMR